MIEQVLQKDYMITSGEVEEEQEQGHGQDTKVGHKVFLERRPDQDRASNEDSRRFHNHGEARRPLLEPSPCCKRL